MPPMPSIPTYQQRTTSSGGLSVEPSQAGQLAGRSLERLGSSIGDAGMMGVQFVQQQNAVNDAQRRADEAKRIQEMEAEGEVLARAKASQIEEHTRATLESRTLDIEEGGTVPGWLGPRNFREDVIEGAKPTIEELRKVNPYAAKYLGPAVERIATDASSALQQRAEARRKNYVLRSAQEGIESDARTLATSSDVQGDYARMRAGWESSLEARWIDRADKTIDPRISFEERDKLRDVMRSKLADVAEQAEMDRLGGRGYLAARGLDPDGNPLSTVRTMKPGAAIVVAGGKWDKAIKAAAEEAGVDPNLVAAVMAQESAGNPDAKSPAGAMGLMQLMPDTAAGLGVDPTVPEQNIQGGARYLAQLMKRYKGDVSLALAAYNAGPGNVDKAGGKVPNYPETQAYVKKITAKYQAATQEVPAAPSKLPPSWTSLDPETQVRWREQAVRKVAQQKSERAETLRTWFANAESLAKAGRVPDGAPTMREALDIYGPDQGVQMFARAQGLVKLGKSMSGLADASDSDIAARLASMAPDPNRPETFAANSASYQDLAQASEGVMRERRRDPVGWALSNNPDVNKAAREMQAAPRELQPQARQKYAQALVGAQARYGVRDPQILSKDQAADLAIALSDPKSYEFAGERLAEEQRSWGAYWPMVHRQIAKDIPPALDVIASGLPRQTSAIVARLAGTKLEDMRATVPSDTKRVVSDEINGTLDQFTRSLVMQSPDDGRATATLYRNEAEKLALHYVGQGMDPSTAARKAAGDIASSRYAFVEQKGYIRGGDSRTPIAPVYRIPVEHDADLVQKGIDRIRYAMKPADVMAPIGMDQAGWLGQIKSQGYWVTTPNEDGLELHLAGDPVTRPDGSPIRVGFQSAINASTPKYLQNLRDESTRLGMPVAVPRASSPSDRSSVAPTPRTIYTETP